MMERGLGRGGTKTNAWGCSKHHAEYVGVSGLKTDNGKETPYLHSISSRIVLRVVVKNHMEGYPSVTGGLKLLNSGGIKLVHRSNPSTKNNC